MSKPTIVLAAIAVATLAACASGKSSGAGSPQPSAAASPEAALNCGAQAPVWALERPKIYLLPGDRLYGKTKRGTYLCRSQAHALGYRPARHPLARP
jgi:hypothetical protein